MKAIILLGAPGVGKGTVAEAIRDKMKLAHLSTGDMLRAAVKAGTPTGQKAESFMKRGELVPDEVILDLVFDRIDREAKDTVYLFDGFPRTIEQATMLDNGLARREGAVERVVLLDAPRDLCIERLCGRLTCRKCAAIYHAKNHPPKVAGRCDLCGGDVVTRPDDKRETIENRLDVFKRQTEGLVALYDERGLLVRINSAQPKEKTIADTVRALGEKKRGPEQVGCDPNKK